MLKRFKHHAHFFQEAAAVPPFEHDFDAVSELTSKTMQEAIKRGIEEAMLTGASTLLTELSLSLRFDLEDPRAVAYLENRGAALVSGINETTREGIKDILANGVKENFSYGQIAKQIKDQFDGFSAPSPLQHIRNRAELIADTELGNAFESTRSTVASDLMSGGIDMEKSWLTIGDDRVSEDCSSNEAAGWIPAQDNFPSGDDTPLAHPGCRCTALYRRAK